MVVEERAPLERLRPKRGKKPVECDVDLEMGDSDKEKDGRRDGESTGGTLTDFDKEKEEEEMEEEKPSAYGRRDGIYLVAQPIPPSPTTFRVHPFSRTTTVTLRDRGASSSSSTR